MAGPSVIRIDHCKIVGGFNYINANFAIRGTGRVTGVIDNNEFLNCGPCVFVTDVRVGDPVWGQTSWSEATHPGTGDMLYFEDNTVHFTSAFQNQNADAAAIYGQYGGRIVVRYNHFGTSSADAFQQDWIDAHGDATSAGYSTVFYEVYNNTFYSGSLGTLGTGTGIYALRGGQAIVHDNIFNTGPPPLGLGIYNVSDVRTISNTYYWNNTFNGGTTQSSQVFFWDGDPSCSPCISGRCPSGYTCGGYSAAHLALNSNYFLHAPTSGQTYFPYTPLVHPHPLVTRGGPTPTPTPTPVPTPTPTPLGLSFNSTVGDITAPFIANADNSISQSVDTDDPAQGGRAAYNFAVTDPGDYTILCLVNCPDGGSNSFFVDLDGDPISTMVWQVPVTSGFESRTVTWSGITTPRFWTLTAATHQLVIRGREAGAKIRSITLALRPSPPAAPEVVPNPGNN